MLHSGKHEKLFDIKSRINENSRELVLLKLLNDLKNLTA